MRVWRDPSGKFFLVKGVRPGLSTLFTRSRAGKSSTRILRVEARHSLPYPDALLRAIGTLEAIEVIDGGSGFILRGSVRNRDEARTIANLRERFPAFVVDETRLDPAWAEASARRLEAILASYPETLLRRDREEFLIEGSVPNEAALASLRKQIREIQPLARIAVRPPSERDSTLYFKVFLLEMRKDLLNRLGVAWPGSVPAAIGFDPLTLLGGRSIDLSIHALSEKGIARLLSSPELVVKAPGQAELFSGGELPIRQRSRFNDSVSWKTFGLTLRLDVKELAGNLVRLGIETEISQIDPSLDTEELPGLKSNRIKTLVDSRMDEPLLLSGLLQEDIRDRAGGLPWLSDIPVLGKLFSSQDYRNRRSELVAILLPHRKPPSSPQTRIASGLPRGFLPLPRDHMSAGEREDARASPDYPWNVL